MSNTALTMVWELSEQEGSRLLIMLAVADSINRETGTTFLSLDYLAKKARVSRRTLLDQLGPLEKSNELRIGHGEGPRGCNVYCLGSFYKWGANFAPPSSETAVAETVPPTSGGGAEFARVRNAAAISHPYLIVPSTDSPPLEEYKVLEGMGANSARGFAPPADTPGQNSHWPHVLETLKSEIGRSAWDTWLASTAATGFENGVLRVATANEYCRRWLIANVQNRAEAILAQQTGQVVHVEFVVGEVPDA